MPSDSLSPTDPTSSTDPTDPTDPRPPAAPGRRSFLRGMAGGVAGGVIAGGAAGTAAGYAYRGAPADPAAAANEAFVTGRLPAVPFHGKYQAGILPAPSQATAVVSFNATAQSRAELTELFQTVTDRARFLTVGGTPPLTGIGGPPADSGVLGPTVVPDGLTVTFGVGSTLFDDRYGLASLAPRSPGADDRVPQRRPRPGAVRRGPDPPAQRRARRHRAARAARHRQEHPRRHAGELADRRLRIAGPADRHGAAGTCSGSWTASRTRRSPPPQPWTPWSGWSRARPASRPGPPTAATSWCG